MAVRRVSVPPAGHGPQCVEAEVQKGVVDAPGIPVDPQRFTGKRLGDLDGVPGAVLQEDAHLHDERVQFERGLDQE
jgi:hypothetical protein